MHLCGGIKKKINKINKHYDIYTYIHTLQANCIHKSK